MQFHPSIFAQGMRQFFIETKEQDALFPIDLGIRLEHDKEKLLAQRLNENINSVVTVNDSNVVDGLDKAIKQLHTNSFEANVIFAFNTIFYTHIEILNNSRRFHANNKVDKNSLPFEHEGVFDEIPVVHIYAPAFQNLIIICNLVKAIKMLQRENETWVVKRLLLEIKKIFKNDVETIFENRKGQYGELLTEQIRYKILCSMEIDINEICGFEIINRNAIIALSIK